MHMRLFALIFILFSPLAFALDAIDLLNDLPAVPIMAVVVGIFIGITGMFANALQNPQLEAWFKNELREYFAALILICIVTIALISSNGVSYALTGTSDYVTKATQVVDKWVGWYDGAYFDIIRAATKLRSAATYAPYANLPLWYVSVSYSSNPLAGAAMFFIPLTAATAALTNAIFLAEGVRLLLAFCSVVVPEILLPLSFVLRMVPFTRKLGSTMIGVSIAAGTLIPFAVIFVDELNTSVTVPVPRIADLGAFDASSSAMGLAEPMCELAPMRIMMGLTDPLFALVVCVVFLLIPIVGGAIFAACYSIVQYVVYPLLTTLFQLIMTILIVLWEFQVDTSGYGVDVYNQLYPFVRDVNNLALLAYIDYILIGTIAVVGARGISTALGGEWYMAGIQRLI